MPNDTLAGAPPGDIHLGGLARSVDVTLASVLATEFPVDPILGREISDLVSKAASLQKRHGLLLEAGIVAALRASGRFEVLTGVSIPITAAADSLVASTPPETLERIALRYDAPVSRAVNMDFVVVDLEAGWAGAYDCKRGNGTLTTRLLRPLVRDVECVGILLRSFLRDRGYAAVDRVTAGLVDIYGQSGVPAHLAVGLRDLDAHFGVPVASILEAMNRRLTAGFKAAVPGLLASVQAKVSEEAAHRAVMDGPVDAGPRATAVRTPARLAGPGRLTARRAPGRHPGRRPGVPPAARQPLDPARRARG
ncbi:hypothetical protein MPAR168_22715 [Methylorubrum populi]|uniref:Restriction endonuclease n=1 Tax=Methylobacterium radiotolerans TaxID=31998 RepID=A0ABU7TGH9_9HYPH